MGNIKTYAIVIIVNNEEFKTPIAEKTIKLFGKSNVISAYSSFTTPKLIAVKPIEAKEGRTLEEAFLNSEKELFEFIKSYPNIHDVFYTFYDIDEKSEKLIIKTNQ